MKAYHPSIEVLKIRITADKNADEIWGLVCQAWKNKGYKNGQILDNRFVANVRNSTDAWITVIDTEFVDVLESPVKLGLEQIGFMEYKLSFNNSPLYRYIRED